MLLGATLASVFSDLRLTAEAAGFDGLSDSFKEGALRDGFGANGSLVLIGL